jgi:beta-galactosidase
MSRFFIVTWVRFRLNAIIPIALFISGTICVAQTRQTLDSGWEFYQGSVGSIWEIWRGDKATDNVTWTPVILPHCFNGRDSVDPDVRYYQGPGWYRTKISIKNPYTEGRTLLHFDGAGQKSRVFVGMKNVGEHNGGYDQWDVDITDAISKVDSQAALPVAVFCDNSRDSESIPSDLSDFNRYGGLYRHVSLVYCPQVSLQRIHIESAIGEGSNSIVKIRARLYNPTSYRDDIELSIKIQDGYGKTIHESNQKMSPWDDEKEVEVFNITDSKLWSPTSPHLYSCIAILKSKSGEGGLKERFGVRSLEWIEHGPFKLNAERLLLRGTHYHEDHAGVAAAVPDEVVRQTLKSMKEMGVNFVRLGHYQQAPLVLDLCDELGILAWEEIPWCRGGLGGDSYKQLCRDMQRNMIDQHFNHPSIILWGLGNENDWPGDFETFDKTAIRNFMGILNTQAHQLDPSRKTVIRRCDFCKDIPDIYSPSIWAGWYGGRYIEYKAALEKNIRDTPFFFHAEYGGDSHARRHSEDPEKFLGKVATGEGTAEVGKAYKADGGKARASKDGDWSESYMINLFDWHLKEQESMTNLTGAAMWIFKDFATPLRPENPVPRVNQKGVLERDGTPKESYYVFQSYWAEKPMLHIYGHTWPVRWGKSDEPKLVKCFSNCREVELFVNGVSAGAKLRDIAAYPASGLNWMVKLKEGTNFLRAIGKTGGAPIIDEIVFQYQTASWDKPDHLTLNEISREGDVVTVEAHAFDKAGTACLDASEVVRFGVTGNGRLLDNLGTSTGSRVLQLYNGCARIRIQCGHGGAMASVSNEKLETTFLKLQNSK